MAKRFTDTNKFRSPFYRSLPSAYKLFWDLINLDCDHSGIWIVDLEIAQIYIGKDAKIDKEKALVLFNTGDVRIIQLDNGKSWFIVPFLNEQYGKLNPANRVHSSVISNLAYLGKLKASCKFFVRRLKIFVFMLKFWNVLLNITYIAVFPKQMKGL